MESRFREGIEILRVDPPEPRADELARRLYEASAPSVVRIKAKDWEGQHSGSGFFVSDTCQIATGKHVVGDAEKVDVYTFQGKHRKAVVESVDHAHDLALLKLEKCNPSEQAHLELDASHKLSPGQRVYALGHPGGRRETAISPGSFNAWRIIRFDAKPWIPTQTGMEARMQIKPGNSGGPLVDVHGKAVGVAEAVGDSQTSYFVAIEHVRRLLHGKLDSN